MMTSLLEEAKNWPPSVSISFVICSPVRFVVDCRKIRQLRAFNSICVRLTLYANLSIIWLLPLLPSHSKRLPAPTYTPAATKWPGVPSVATLTPFGSVVTCSRSSEADADGICGFAEAFTADAFLEAGLDVDSFLD